MEPVSINQIKHTIAAARSDNDAQTLRMLGRAVLHGKAALHAHALTVYKHTNPAEWYQWVKHSLQGVCSAKDIYTITYSAVVLARLDETNILIDGRKLDSWFFITKRLTYLHDALPILRSLNHNKQGNRLFEQVISAAATMSRADLRAYLDLLNFGEDTRAVCHRKAKGGLVTFTIVCDEQQAEKLEARLQHLVTIQ